MKLIANHCRIFFLSLTILVSALSYGSISLADGPSCRSVFFKTLTPEEALQALLDVSDYYRKEKADISSPQVVEKAFAQIEKSGFLKGYKSWPSSTHQNKAAILKDYAARTWSLFLDPANLKKMRDQSIDRQLDIRGAPKYRGLSGRARLERVSRENLERLVKEHGLDEKVELSFFGEKDLALISGDFDIVAERNGRTADVWGPGLLSSRQLTRFGGVGENSRHKLNNTTLEVDNDIFFRLFYDFGNSGSKGRSGSANEYGDYSFSAVKKLFEEEGIVSPYIMWVTDLQRWAEKALPHLKGTAKPSEDWEVGPYEMEAIKYLHKYDFTVRDFKKLLFAKVRMVEAKNPGILERYRGMDHSEKYKFWDEQVLKPLGFSMSELELRVPVYIPGDLINQIK